MAEGFVTEDNQGLADMLSGWGSENQLSNNGINSLISKYNEDNAGAKEEAINAEFAKLGEDASARIDNAKSFLEANLGVELTQGLAANMNTASAIEGIEKLISMSKAPKVAPSETTPFADKEKTESMRYALDDNGNRKMEDPKYRQMVLAMEAKLRA